ncbi:MAG: hypothetical protein ACI9K2_000582 [Myxococcota bacterium]|jgi:hypothetical protein
MRSWLVIALGSLALVSCSDTEEGTDGTDAKGFEEAGGFIEGDAALSGQDYSVIDEFTFYVSPVDVLFVIDDSCSMSEEQEALSVGFPGFFSLIEVIGDQYQIGVISTDMDNPDKSGKLRESGGYKWIDAETEDPFLVFEEMAGLGIEGSGIEKGIFATYTALETLADTDNAGFLREDAALMVVVLSDEPDFTEDSDIRLADFRDWFASLKVDPEPGWLTFNGIVGPPPSGCSSAVGNAESGDGYIQIAEFTGGVLHSICETPYGPAFDAMVGAIPSEEFYLSDVPDPSSIRISAKLPNGETTYMNDEQWQYFADENYITLNNALQDESQVFIRYLPLSLLQQQ